MSDHQNDTNNDQAISVQPNISQNKFVLVEDSSGGRDPTKMHESKPGQDVPAVQPITIETVTVHSLPIPKTYSTPDQTKKMEDEENYDKVEEMRDESPPIGREFEEVHSDEEATRFERSSFSTLSRSRLRVFRQLMCCGVPLEANSEENISYCRDPGL